MTPAGWVFMAVSIGFVVALVVFCYSRVLRPVPPAAGEDDAAQRDPRKAPP